MTFTLIGLVVSLFIVWRVFEYKSYDKRTLDDLQRTVEVIEEEMKIAQEQLQVVNIPEKIKAEVEELEEDIIVTVSGYGSVDSVVNAENIKAKVDILSYMNGNNLIELQPGSYEMQLRFETPEGVWIKEEVKVPVKISAK